MSRPVAIPVIRSLEKHGIDNENELTLTEMELMKFGAEELRNESSAIVSRITDATNSSTINTAAPDQQDGGANYSHVANAMKFSGAPANTTSTTSYSGVSTFTNSEETKRRGRNNRARSPGR